jgi:hypothetical protein
MRGLRQAAIVCVLSLAIRAANLKLISFAAAKLMPLFGDTSTAPGGFMCHQFSLRH